MARIGLTSGFSLIPEGTFVFYIYDCTYDEDFGKLSVKLITADGQKHEERFRLKDDNDMINEKAMNAFSYFAKTALNNFNLTDIDHTDIIGHYIRADVVHTTMPSRKDGSPMTFANLGQKYSADGFENEPCQTVKELIQKQHPAPAITASDLDSLLG